MVTLVFRLSEWTPACVKGRDRRTDDRIGSHKDDCRSFENMWAPTLLVLMLMTSVTKFFCHDEGM